MSPGQIWLTGASDAVTVNDFVTTHPDLGFSEFVQFLVEHPQLMERVQGLDSALAEERVGSTSR